MWRLLLYLCVVECCTNLPLSEFVSFPIRVVVDVAFVEKAVEASAGMDKRAATCKLVTDLFKRVTAFYKKEMNFGFHAEGRIIMPDEPDAPSLLTRNCRGKNWQSRTGSLFHSYVQKLGGGDVSAFLSGCKGRGSAYPGGGGACAKGSTSTVVPWGAKTRFEWFILAHELGHTLKMPDYVQRGKYISGYMMGQTYSCCTDAGCKCKPFRDSEKKRACAAIKKGGSECAKTSPGPACSVGPSTPQTPENPTTTTSGTSSQTPINPTTTTSGTSSQTPINPTTMPSQTPGTEDNTDSTFIIGGICATVCVCLLIAGLGYWRSHKPPNEKEKSRIHHNNRSQKVHRRPSKKRLSKKRRSNKRRGSNIQR